MWSRLQALSPLLAVWLVLSTFADTARADRESCLAAHEKAQEQRLRGRYVEAREQLLSCSQASCPQLLVKDCTGWLSELEASLPSVVFAVEDGRGGDLIDVRVSEGEKLLSQRADGRALAIDPGVHQLRFEAKGYAPQELALSVRESEKRRIVRVQLVRQAQAVNASGARRSEEAAIGADATRRARLFSASYVLSGVSLAVVGTGIGFAVAGKRKLDDLEQGCGRTQSCSGRAVQVGQRRYRIADAAFAVSGGAAVAALLSYLFARRLEREDTHTLSCAATRQSFYCGASSRF